jgi:hypothetical protein
MGERNTSSCSGARRKVSDRTSSSALISSLIAHRSTITSLVAFPVVILSYAHRVIVTFGRDGWRL